MPRIRSRGGLPQSLAAKVPEITVMFWVLKLITTGMGEAMSDFLGNTSVPLAGFVGIFGMWLALRLQTRTRKYDAVHYWFTVMMIAIFGTMIADGIHDGAGLSYAVTTPLFAAAVGVILFLWYRSEGTLSIHSITTSRRERYYWATVFATFALGTAAGDLTATSLGLGFFGSVLLFAGAIMVPAFAWWKLHLHPIIAFWAAYVITRPLGASFADWFSKPHSITGLGLGDGTVSALALIVFVVLVAWVAITEHGVQREEHAHPHAHGPRPHWDVALDPEPSDS